MSAPTGQKPKTRIPFRTVVLRTEQLSPSMVRVVLGGEDLARFTLSDATDSYVKAVFLTPGVEYPHPLDLSAIRAEMPSAVHPRLRTYTVRSFDPELGELTLDFVVHGTSGLAGPWAAQAEPGQELYLLGPGGGYRPSTDADWYLYVGDESAIPAISVSLERLPAGSNARVFLEVHDAAEELPTVDGIDVTWVHRGDEPVGAAIVQAVRDCEFPSGQVDAFVHGEAGFVKQLRALLLTDRAIPREHLSISGYWRLGSDDEAWRAAKAEWARD